MLPINYWSWQLSFLELPKSCQQWELTFLSTMVFRATKILSIVRVDSSVNRSFQNYQNPDNFKGWRSCSFHSYQKPGRHYASRQLSDLTTQFFRATKILSTVGVDIPADRSFHSYQNPDNFKSWRSCSFQSYPTPGRHYASRQLSVVTM